MVNSNLIPEVINNWNAYNKGNKLIGVTGSVTLPNLDAITEQITGAGVLGSYETGIIGHYGPIEQEVPFRMLEEDIFALMDPTQSVDLTFRASTQYTERETGAIDYKGMRIVETGRFKGFSAGKLEAGKAMEGTLKLEILSFMVELNGRKLVQLDKLNDRFIVNDKDMLEKVRKFS